MVDRVWNLLQSLRVHVCQALLAFERSTLVCAGTFIAGHPHGSYLELGRINEWLDFPLLNLPQKKLHVWAPLLGVVVEEKAPQRR